MASIEDFSEREWRELLAELRLMVASAGFGEWDAAAAAALEDEAEGPPSAREELLQYARAFARFLKVRSAWNLERMRGELGELLRAENGQPVTAAVVYDERSERADEILGGESSDALLAEITAFANAVAGDGDGDFFDAEDEA